MQPVLVCPCGSLTISKNHRLKRYGRIAKVNTGLSYEPDFDENVRDCSWFLNLKIVELKGSKRIAEASFFILRPVTRRSKGYA